MNPVRTSLQRFINLRMDVGIVTLVPSPTPLVKQTARIVRVECISIYGAQIVSWIVLNVLEGVSQIKQVKTRKMIAGIVLLVESLVLPTPQPVMTVKSVSTVNESSM
jgi:hypothetical protein